MLFRLQLGLPFLFLLSATALAAQEVAYLDLVGIKPRTELRYPSPPPSVCKDDGTCGFSGGIVGVSVGDGIEATSEPRALKTTLLSLDRFAYAPDDSAEMEIKIENAGSVEMAIPWNPHLTDLQPSDEKQTFQYRSLAVVLKLTNNPNKSQESIIEAAHLYGINEKPDTLRILKPGEWLRLRIRTKLAGSSDKLKMGSEYSASVLPQLRSEIFIPNVKYGGYSTDITNEYPRTVAGPGLKLRITKKEPYAERRGGTLKESEAAIHFK